MKISKSIKGCQQLPVSDIHSMQAVADPNGGMNHKDNACTFVENAIRELGKIPASDSSKCLDECIANLAVVLMDIKSC